MLRVKEWLLAPLILEVDACGLWPHWDHRLATFDLSLFHGGTDPKMAGLVQGPFAAGGVSDGRAGGTAWHRWNAVPHEYQLFEAFLDDYKAEQI